MDRSTVFPPADMAGVPQPPISTKEIVIIIFMFGLWAYSLYLTYRYSCSLSLSRSRSRSRSSSGSGSGNLFIYQTRESSLVPAGFLTSQFLQKL